MKDFKEFILSSDELNEAKKISKKELTKLINSLSGTQISDTFVKGGKKDDAKIDVATLIGKLKESVDVDIDVEEEDPLIENMWNLIYSLSDEVLDTLSEEQIGDYVEIIETVAGPEGEEVDLEEEMKILNKGQKVKETKKGPFGKKGIGKIVSMDTKNQIWTVKFSGDDEKYEYHKGEIELAEAMPAKRVRRDVVQKRKASREHRKVKAKRKIQGRRKRKTAKFKRFKKKSKRLGKRGLTSTGKRKRTFINKG